MNNTQSNIEREIGWDDAISQESSDWVLLPEGDYNFTVTKMERARHPGSQKLPPCNKAILSLHIETPEGLSTTIQHNLFLHTRTEGMISAFLIAIGQKKHNEPTIPKWGQMVGAKGRCKIGIREWTGNDGEVRKSNEVKKFYDPEESAPQQAVSSNAAVPGGGVFTPNKFVAGKF